MKREALKRVDRLLKLFCGMVTPDRTTLSRARLDTNGVVVCGANEMFMHPETFRRMFGLEEYERIAELPRIPSIYEEIDDNGEAFAVLPGPSPRHPTVVFIYRGVSKRIAHIPSELCVIEGPHLMGECGEFERGA